MGWPSAMNGMGGALLVVAVGRCLPKLLKPSAANVRRQKLTSLLLAFLVMVYRTGNILLDNTRRKRFADGQPTPALEVALKTSRRANRGFAVCSLEAAKRSQEWREANVRAQARASRAYRRNRMRTRSCVRGYGQKFIEASAIHDARLRLAILRWKCFRIQTELPYVPEAERAAYTALLGDESRLCHGRTAVRFQFPRSTARDGATDWFCGQRWPGALFWFI